MFTELMPLLRQRVLMLTISRVDDELILVNVIPKKRDNESDENTALTLPLSFRGKPEELDRELPAQLAAYTESVIQTGSNLDDVKAQHAAAVKAVEAENRKRLDEKKKAGGKSVPPPEKRDGAAEFRDGKPVFGSKATSASAAPASLFDQSEAGSDAAVVSPVEAGTEA
jgi:PRTRC genetic system protein E